MITLKFKLNRSSPEVYSQIIEMIPELEIDWTFDDTKEMFYTILDEIMEIQVFKDKVEIFVREDNNVRSKAFHNLDKHKNKKPVMLYTRLKERFDMNEDYDIYEKIHGHLKKSTTKHKKDNERYFTEDNYK